MEFDKDVVGYPAASGRAGGSPAGSAGTPASSAATPSGAPVPSGAPAAAGRAPAATPSGAPAAAGRAPAPVPAVAPVPMGSTSVPGVCVLPPEDPEPGEPGEPGAGVDASNSKSPSSRVYVCIDLKSFYASVECVDRGLDPFTTNLVVADVARSVNTICLAITPAMKMLGIRNRCRIREIPPGVEYIAAKPRMRRYMEVSADIYSIYLRYVSSEDVHVYSVDECFIDVTPYLRLYDRTPRQMAAMLMDAVFQETGICATAGVGTNLFLAKVALDIIAKHEFDHIGFLDEEEFKRRIWTHRPITDIWNIGPGIAARLEKYGVHDLLGVCWLDEKLLYREFGVNAEYLIDHAHGHEPCTIAQIHAYVPEGSSLSNGQVLPSNYTFDEARVVLKEMVDALTLELVDKHLVTESIALYIGYGDAFSQARAGAAGFSSGREDHGFGSGSASSGVAGFGGAGGASGAGPGAVSAAGGGAGNPWGVDDGEGSPWDGGYGGGASGVTYGPARSFDKPGGKPANSVAMEAAFYRSLPHTGGSRKLGERTSSYRKLVPLFEELYDQTTDRDRPIRRINVCFGHVLPEEFVTVDLFTDVESMEKEHRLQQAVLAVKGKYGKNALLKGMSFAPKATARERNEQVGGHHA